MGKDIHLNKPLEAAKAFIANLDFSMIVQKMVRDDGWQYECALEVSQLYRNFLYLVLKYGDEYPELPPSLEIDAFWHNHILDTQQYIQDCQTIFGRYLHHYPYQVVDGKMTAEEAHQGFEKLQSLYQQEFGEYIYAIPKRRITYWPRKIANSLKSWFKKS
jgi:hypothetical protein